MAEGWWSHQRRKEEGGVCKFLDGNVDYSWRNIGCSSEVEKNVSKMMPIFLTPINGRLVETHIRFSFTV